MKMVEWANIRPNERALEPSAGHGAIARFFPDYSSNTFIEPSAKLAADIALLSNGEAKATHTGPAARRPSSTWRWP